MTLEELIAQAVIEVAEAEAETERRTIELIAQRRQAEIRSFQVQVQEKLPRLYPFVQTWMWHSDDGPTAVFDNGLSVAFDECWVIRDGHKKHLEDLEAGENYVLVAMSDFLNAAKR
jgi:hypothetical protein